MTGIKEIPDFLEKKCEFLCVSIGYVNQPEAMSGLLELKFFGIKCNWEFWGILGNHSFQQSNTPDKPVIFAILGGFAAENRGADFVKYLVPALRARTRYLTGHRTPSNQTASVCSAHGAGQHRN